MVIRQLREWHGGALLKICFQQIFYFVSNCDEWSMQGWGIEGRVLGCRHNVIWRVDLGGGHNTYLRGKVREHACAGEECD